MKWIRVLYSDFHTFARDQERLISAEKTFDYIEGQVIVNRTDLFNNWRSSFDLEDTDQANQFVSDGRTLFCLELTKNFNPGEEAAIDKVRYKTHHHSPLEKQRMCKILILFFSYAGNKIVTI